MTKELEYTLIFVSGVAIGAASAWYFTKDKYEKYANEEINEVRKYYLKKREKIDNIEVIDASEITTGTIDVTSFEEPVGSLLENLAEVLEDYGGDPEIPEHKEESIYEIDGIDFGEFDNYECITLTYYILDNVLCDDMMQPLDDRKAIVGNFDFEKAYITDCIYIRNDNLHSDYEVLMQDSKYSDYILKHPSDSTIPFYLDNEEE